MTEKIDYYISAIRRSSDRRISHLKVHKNEDFNNPSIWTAEQVIQYIEARYVFYTTYIGNDGKYKIGAKVEVFIMNGQKYLRTNRDRTAIDNLENLPEF